MAFFGFGKKKENEDVEKIKSAVSGPQMMDMPQVPEEVPQIETSIELKEPGKVDFAPLFIKIDRYREILEKVKMLQDSVDNMDDLSKMRSSVERIRAELDGLTERQIDNFKTIMASLDKDFIKPMNSNISLKPAKSERIETHIDEVKSEIEKIEDEIRKLENR